MKKIAIIGCGGHSRSVADIILGKNENTELLFIDKNAKKDEIILNFKVVKDYSLKNLPVVIAIGDNKKRKNVFEEMENINIISVISKIAYISNSSLIGRGSFVGNWCHIGPETIIGKNTIINTGALVEHEVKIGDHCHIAPNATICGRSKLGNQIFVGAGATILDYIDICSNVTIGAGAVVADRIDDPGIYIGCPAKKIEKYVDKR